MPATLINNDTNSIANVDWEDILDTLADQKCMLFLGCGAYLSLDGINIETTLSNWLDASNPKHPQIRLYNPDGFYLFRNGGSRRRVIGSIKEFYNQEFRETEKHFSKIAQVPFSMIFTLNYDNILARTFDQLGFDYQSDFYFKHRKASEKFEKPSRNKPLIYNMMGNIEEPESLILTHANFFDYLDSIFKSNSMNQELKEEVEKAEMYIFLGLPYEKWYFQMVLRILSLHSDKLKEIERIALKEFENPRLQEIYTEEFKMEFIPTNTEAFIDELYRRCSVKGLLKPLPRNDLTDTNLKLLPIDTIRDLVGNADVMEAMRQLKLYINHRKVKSSKISIDLVVLHNRLNLLKQREIRGTIYPQDFLVEWNQIIEKLLELINQAENI